MNRLSVVVWCAVSAWQAVAAPIQVAVPVEGDSFVRSLAPTSNYGRAGGLSVSGSAAVNASGQQMGLLDTFMRFDLSAFVAAMDASFGAGAWRVEQAVLELTEQGAPNNPIFNRGVGQFEVRWLANDAWAEGTGTPNAPTTDGVSYSSEPSLLDGLVDETLGIYANSGADGPLAFTLGLADGFLQDILAGGQVSFFLTAASDSVGFTFNSRNIGAPRPPPELLLTADAIPEPASAALLGLALGAAAWRRRTRRG